ncbi:RNA pseudouridylate synthase domain containing protein 2 [Mactra antiquata]
MITINTAHKKLVSYSIIRFLRMSYNKPNQSVAEGSKELSLRAVRRKRGIELFRTKHGVNRQPEPETAVGDEKVYYIENGLRKVYPYYYSFGTYSKGRWCGKSILEGFCEEFSRTGDNHKELIGKGRITVNGKKVSPDFILHENMLLEHTTHRHETPVLNTSIEIIEDTNDILVINKPSSIPVHPCGRHRKNSITELLKVQLGYDNLRVLHRLDRLTSGVLIMPKTTKTSKKLESQLQRKLLHKEYICRVVGKFPDGEIKCEAPLRCFSQKLAIHGVDEKKGKPSLTTFTRINYNGRTSVVKCIPHTGRTHQIRIHLQYLGHPICNDPLYNTTVVGPSKGKDGLVERSVTEMELEVMKTSNIGRWRKGKNPRYIAQYGDFDDEPQNPKEENSAESIKSEVEKSSKSVNDNDMAESKKKMSENMQSENIEKHAVSDLKEEQIEVTVSTDMDNLKSDSARNDTESEYPSKRLKLDESEIFDKVSDSVVINTKEISVEVNADLDNVAKMVDESDNHDCVESDRKVEVYETSDKTKVEGENDKCAGEQIEIKRNDKSEGNYDIHGESNKSVEFDKHHNEIGSTDKNINTVIEVNKPSDDANEIVKTNEVPSETDSNIEVRSRSYIIEMVAEDNTDMIYDVNKDILDESCQECKYSYISPQRSDLILYLHAVSYKGPDWEYRTSLPYWADEDFDERTEARSNVKHY